MFCDSFLVLGAVAGDGENFGNPKNGGAIGGGDGGKKWRQDHGNARERRRSCIECEVAQNVLSSAGFEAL